MRQCPLKYKECPLRCPLSGKVLCSFEIQAAKATNGQKNGSVAETIRALPDLTSCIVTKSRSSLCEFIPNCLSNNWSLGTGEAKLVAR